MCWQRKMDGVTMKNEKIEKRLHTYLEKEEMPPYAILLRGEWGCGKTFFVREFINKENHKDKDIWYISVFGVKNVDEINEKIFEVAYPALSSKKTQGFLSIGYSVLKTMSKKQWGIDIGEVGVSIKNLVKEEGKKLPCRLLIVDDLERAVISIKELFGYFSTILEDGVRIIFIADEDKIDGDRGEYGAYKEKIIGETYEVSSEYKEAIKSIVGDLEKSLDQEIENLVFSITDVLKCRNLRVVKQALYQWDVLFENLHSTYINDLETLHDFFERYFVLQIQYKQKCFQTEDIGEFLKTCQEAWVAYRGYHMSLSEYRTTKEAEDSDEKKMFFMDKIIYKLDILEAWHDLLVLGKTIDEEWLNQQVETIYQKKEKEREREKELNSSIYQMRRIIMGQENRDMEGVKNLFETLNRDFSDGKYIYFDDIMEYIHIYMKLVEDEVLPQEYSDESLNKSLKIFIEEYADKISFRAPKEEFTHQVDSLGNDALDESINKILDFSVKKNKHNKMTIFHSKDNFFQLIAAPDNAINFELSSPFLKQLDLETLFNWLESDPSMEKHREMLTFLEYRYGKGLGNRSLSRVDYQDLNSVKELKNIYEKEIDKQRHNYSIVIGVYKNLRNKYEDLWLYMKHCINDKQEEDTTQ